jgi:hypothetical protein
MELERTYLLLCISVTIFWRMCKFATKF